MHEMEIFELESDEEDVEQANIRKLTGTLNELNRAGWGRMDLDNVTQILAGIPNQIREQCQGIIDGTQKASADWAKAKKSGMSQAEQKKVDQALQRTHEALKLMSLQMEPQGHKPGRESKALLPASTSARPSGRPGDRTIKMDKALMRPPADDQGNNKRQRTGDVGNTSQVCPKIMPN